MRPIVVDTSVWIEWLHGKRGELREEARGRIQFLVATVAMELLSGAHARKDAQLISNVIETFHRHHRIIVPGLSEYRMAGSTLADLAWPASKKSNDVLICVCARRIGAEIWTLDQDDYSPISAALRVPLKNM